MFKKEAKYNSNRLDETLTLRNRNCAYVQNTGN
jgi:hypothetical protein